MILFWRNWRYPSWFWPRGWVALHLSRLATGSTFVVDKLTPDFWTLFNRSICKTFSLNLLPRFPSNAQGTPWISATIRTLYTWFMRPDAIDTRFRATRGKSSGSPPFQGGTMRPSPCLMAYGSLGAAAAKNILNRWRGMMSKRKSGRWWGNLRSQL